MVVDHLVIIGFMKKGDGEAIFGAESLLGKYQNRKVSPPLSCHLIHVNPGLSLQQFKDGKFVKGKNYVYEEDTKEIDAKVAESNNVGVYLIFHGSGNSEPHIFEAQKSARYAGHLAKNETGLAVAQVLHKLGLRKVKKLCLLMCNGAIENDSFVVHLCAGLKQVLESPPMVAGWDSFISLQMGSGGRKIMNKQNDHSTAQFKNEHKKVYVYKGENYEKKTLVNSGWSDKIQLPTDNHDVTIV